VQTLSAFCFPSETVLESPRFHSVAPATDDDVVWDSWMSLGQIVNPLEMRSDDILESIQMTKEANSISFPAARRFQSQTRSEKSLGFPKKTPVNRGGTVVAVNLCSGKSQRGNRHRQFNRQRRCRVNMYFSCSKTSKESGRKSSSKL